MALKNLIFLLLMYAFGISNIYGQNSQKQFLKFNKQQPTTSQFSEKNNGLNSNKTNSNKLADKIINNLALNESEAKTIHELCDERANKIEKIKLNSDNSQQKIKDLQDVNLVFDLKIKSLVTPTQFSKYENLRKRKRSLLLF